MPPKFPKFINYYITLNRSDAGVLAIGVELPTTSRRRETSGMRSGTPEAGAWLGVLNITVNIAR
jgi:hypothetical protein